MDSLLLVATHLTLRKKLRWWRLLLAAVCGVAITVCTPLVNGAWTYVLKAICLVVITFVANGRRFWLRYVLVFSAYTALLGGTIVALFWILQIDFDVNTSISYFHGVPISLYILAVVLFATSVYLVVVYIRNARKHDAFMCRVTVSWQGNIVQDKKAFLDSGNSLCVGGVPVCFVLPPLDKQLRKAVAEAIIEGNAIKVNYATMSGDVCTFGIVGTVEYKGNTVDAIFALPKTGRRANYEILLNNAFLEVRDETTTTTKANTQ